MKETMKHRLVGAAVLVALGVIAWPIIFDTTPVREFSQRSEIPEEPHVDRFEVPEPSPVQVPAEPDSEAQRAAEPQPPTEPLAAAQPAPQPEAPPVPAPHGDEYGLPEQWALQLGVFGQLENALEVREKAEQAGYHAILQSVAANGTTQHRVYIEPKLDRSALDSLLPEVERKLGIKGYVTRYRP